MASQSLFLVLMSFSLASRDRMASDQPLRQFSRLKSEILFGKLEDHVAVAFLLPFSCLGRY